MITAETRKRIQIVGTIATLLLPTTFVAFPYLWMALSSFSPDKDLFSDRILPASLTLAHYRELFERTNFAEQFLNSVIVAVIATAICLTISTLAGYSLSRFRHRWSFERVMLIIYTIPPVLLVIPILLVFSRIRLTSTYVGLALGHSTFMLPFATLILSAYFNNIPTTLDEAALVDGTGRLGALLRIVLPLALPGIAATGIVIFAFSWNDYVFAFTLIAVKKMQTLPLGVQELAEGQTLQWGMLMSSAVLITAPMLLFFLLIQRKLLAGFIFAVTGEK
ncbi:MAG: carbohydrate ABC transporter permease [Deltaproteobacteria bacterium]|nr:carbohydrate ABC transporter permease [Deltaproteobacteria bacterium]MBW2122521.1 carbohydrate ABC transporter permease [Deltaproteobacteria bacterium]